MSTAEQAARIETRQFMMPVTIGLLSLALMVAVAVIEGLPIRDPDARYVGSPLALIGLIVAIFIVLDVIPRSVRLAGSAGVAVSEALRRVFSERWWGRRGLIVLACILGFYATYFSYRNLKSFLP